MKSEIATYGGTAAHLINNLQLDPDGVDRLLASTGLPPSYFVSDDNNSHLEYSTPKGNALDGKCSMDADLAMLKKFQVGRRNDAQPERRGGFGLSVPC